MLDDLSVDQLNSEFPEFKITHHISTGGQKAVFRGQYEGEDIVFKILPIESATGEERGDRELEAMERIDHPVMVELKHGFKESLEGERVLIFVEEFVEGSTLRTLIDKREGGLELALQLLQSLLDVLSVFDEENIVHRDIKHLT